MAGAVWSSVHAFLRTKAVPNAREKNMLSVEQLASSLMSCLSALRLLSASSLSMDGSGKQRHPEFGHCLTVTENCIWAVYLHWFSVRESPNEHFKVLAKFRTVRGMESRPEIHEFPF